MGGVALMSEYKKGLGSFLFLLLFVTFANYLYAGTIEVRPGQKIQDAIEDAAVLRETVFVYAGTYCGDISMKNRVDVVGEQYGRVIINGRVYFKDATCSLKNVTVLFPQASLLSYSNPHYANWKIQSEAGIIAINSAPVIQNCVIKPDLETINSLNPYQPPLTHYGKAIEIWNMYNNPDLAPQIEYNLIQNTDCGIYYFSQASGGAIYGEIKNNTFYHNKIGVLLRMHKENPHIYNNVFDSCLESAIHFTYKDAPLFNQRLANINNNLFNANSKDGWLDADGKPFTIVRLQSNISGTPLFIDPTGDVFYLSSRESPCVGTGEGKTNIGAYSEDLQYPTIEDISPEEKRFIGQSNIDISGSAYDDSGILSVYINSNSAVINGTIFSIEDYPLDYGLNDIAITATDVAKKTTLVTESKYLFRMPIAPPQE